MYAAAWITDIAAVFCVYRLSLSTYCFLVFKANSACCVHFSYPYFWKMDDSGVDVQAAVFAHINLLSHIVYQ